MWLPLTVAPYAFLAAEDLRARGTGEAVAVDLDIRDWGRIRARELVRGGGLLVEERLVGEPVKNGIPLEEQELSTVRLEAVAVEAPDANLAALADEDAVRLVIDHKIGVGRHLATVRASEKC